MGWNGWSTWSADWIVLVISLSFRIDFKDSVADCHLIGLGGRQDQTSTGSFP